MALTRCQLLAGNQAQGVVLTGQPQGVTAGLGVNISASGVISFDVTTASGVLKTNNDSAFNAYIWPSSVGSSGQLTLGSGGNLTWISHLPLTGGTMSGTINFVSAQTFDGGTFGA